MAHIEKRKITLKTQPQAPKKTEKKEEEFIESTHEIIPRKTKGWYDVVDQDGKLVNDQALRKQQAEQLKLDMRKT